MNRTAMLWLALAVALVGHSYLRLVPVHREPARASRACAPAHECDWSAAAITLAPAPLPAPVTLAVSVMRPDFTNSATDHPPTPTAPRFGELRAPPRL
ncbi:MAG TPA: hypothetical protein VN709_07620 [Terriglobales bacterium]|nr:hypothetical protein [Terriglobales bacterium]